MKGAVIYTEVAAVFYLSPLSPSWLNWKIDVRAGRNYLIIKAAKDSCVGKKHEGYWKAMYNRDRIYCHRIVYSLANKVDLSNTDKVDHIDGDTGNNSPENLRVVTHAVNMRNRKLRSDSASGITGVCSRTNSSGREYYTGYWQTIEGKQGCSVRYYVDELGRQAAIDAAKEVRDKNIKKLNQKGAGYTDRHGT